MEKRPSRAPHKIFLRGPAVAQMASNVPFLWMFLMGVALWRGLGASREESASADLEARMRSSSLPMAGTLYQLPITQVRCVLLVAVDRCGDPHSKSHRLPLEMAQGSSRDDLMYQGTPLRLNRPMRGKSRDGSPRRMDGQTVVWTYREMDHEKADNAPTHCSTGLRSRPAE